MSSLGHSSFQIFILNVFKKILFIKSIRKKNKNKIKLKSEK